jgi:F-type H+-transporting ATPase subunit b
MDILIPLAAAAEGGIGDTVKDIGLQFGFNGWLFLSQIVSFCIVALLLQKFAYKPVLQILETRRAKIAEGLLNAEKIKQQLAESEVRYQEILTKANAEAQKMIDEARASSQALADKRTQQAIADAEGIMLKARESTIAERQREFAELRKEVARLVIDTTSKVTGKVLNPDDQRRISEEAAREVAA